VSDSLKTTTVTLPKDSQIDADAIRLAHGLKSTACAIRLALEQVAAPIRAELPMDFFSKRRQTLGAKKEIR
jgi:hypothetical protein